MKDYHLPHDWFAAPIPDNVEFGERCWIYSSYAFLHFRSRQRIGLRLGHDSGVYIGGMFEVGPDGTVEVGDFSALVGPIINTNGMVKIGSYVFIAHEVVIADHLAAVPPPDNQVPSPRSASIVVGDNTWIGARAVLLSGARIGEGSIVGAGSVVDFEVEPFSVVAGNPARVVRRLR
jgi:acetyltransferase-like isoleucine patch superfamily enzyme